MKKYINGEYLDLSAEELAAVKGITPETAERIITYFDKGERNKK